MGQGNFKTIARKIEGVLLKQRKSKFYGYAYPLVDNMEVKEIVTRLKKLHPNADHICFAWQMGTEVRSFRVNDDGEPTNSAGMPIYGQIRSFDLTNILVAVVRIFGGNKLGVGGLISAYATVRN